jgi:hypothetical protein
MFESRKQIKIQNRPPDILADPVSSGKKLFCSKELAISVSLKK